MHNIILCRPGLKTAVESSESVCMQHSSYSKSLLLLDSDCVGNSMSRCSMSLTGSLLQAPATGRAPPFLDSNVAPELTSGYFVNFLAHTLHVQLGFLWHQDLLVWSLVLVNILLQHTKAHDANTEAKIAFASWPADLFFRYVVSTLPGTYITRIAKRGPSWQSPCT